MIGVILSNLGTPDAPDSAAVKPYLRQFLMDPFVVDIPAPARWFLVNAIILPKRSHASAEAYRGIWTERGSPLRFHTQDLAHKVARRLGEGFVVEVGMRYGSPSIEGAVQRLASAGVSKIVFLPLYPQYSLAATESSLVEFARAHRAHAAAIPKLVLKDFHVDAGFIAGFVRLGREALEAWRPDHVLFSFHGLPERQVRKSDPTGSRCLANATCCDVVPSFPCYRAQCYASARAIAAGMGLGPDQYSISFQSRLGRTPWIRPYTDETLESLARGGTRRLAVLCPAFVADCLETLEEIGMRGREHFIASGGEDLLLVPSLNSADDWAEKVAGWAKSLSASNS